MSFFSIVITNNCGHFLEENVILRNFEKHFYLLKGCTKSLINALIMGGLDHPWGSKFFPRFKTKAKCQSQNVLPTANESKGPHHYEEVS
jgi:hypothetical protein